MPDLTSSVTTHSIRYRILKVPESRSGIRRQNQVTTHSIRYRILKDLEYISQNNEAPSYNPFDPIQDTESGHRWQANI